MPELFGSMTGALLPWCCPPTGPLLPACVALYRDSHGGGTRLCYSVVCLCLIVQTSLKMTLFMMLSKQPLIVWALANLHFRRNNVNESLKSSKMDKFVVKGVVDRVVEKTAEASKNGRRKLETEMKG